MKCIFFHPLKNNLANDQSGDSSITHVTCMGIKKYELIHSWHKWMKHNTEENVAQQPDSDFSEQKKYLRQEGFTVTLFL